MSLPAARGWFTCEADLLASTTPDAAPGSIGARRRRLAELAAESIWDENHDPIDLQPSVASASLRFRVRHGQPDEPMWADTLPGARAALRGSRAPGRVVELRGLRDSSDDPLEVTGHPNEPIQVLLPGFGASTPLRVTKGAAIVHAGQQSRRAGRERDRAARVDVTVAPGASVLVFGARYGQVNVTVEGDGVAVVVGERYTTGTLARTPDGSIDVIAPTSPDLQVQTH
ncbi:hypothetical protein HF998_08825 [Cellulomonas hominis]|uniref:Uncharacterized protein n=1 Tax=Cellulomonas hominis TaxID=156981 RepID=A0A7W8WBL9_9CELL|nr:hypothetical protein [Cellulomonas hominis]MBB5474632.1 hypothetical protein [Cellulomonas hominis]NKY07071.1 hypothetical protein [Cellulomonas hominis]